MNGQSGQRIASRAWNFSLPPCRPVLFNEANYGEVKMTPEEVKKADANFMDKLAEAAEANDAVFMLLDLFVRKVDCEPFFDSYDEYSEHTDSLKVGAVHAAHMMAVIRRNGGEI